MKHLLHENILYFDLGNNFPEPSQQGNLKIPLIHSALDKFRPEAVLVGPNEWQNGLHWLDYKIPYILSNQNTKLNFFNLKPFIMKPKNYSTWLLITKSCIPE